MVAIDKKLELVRQELLARKYELDRILSQRAHETNEQEAGKDAGDQALSSTLETLNKSLQDSEFEEYNRIVQALSKIDDGTYGICIDCNEPILERRLKYYPNAARCLVCQEIYEDNLGNPTGE
jgi:DnaK suppressor protein